MHANFFVEGKVVDKKSRIYPDFFFTAVLGAYLGYSRGVCLTDFLSFGLS
jgi:hypothetical protein